jgi:hypothetical protein
MTAAGVLVPSSRTADFTHPRHARASRGVMDEAISQFREALRLEAIRL